MEPIQTQEEVNFIVNAFQVGGPVMYVILLVGLAVLFLIVERAMTLKKLRVRKDDFNERLFGMILKGDVREAIRFCDNQPAPLTSTMKAGLIQVLNKRSDEEVQVAMDAAVLRETPRIEGWTAFLAVFGNIATLVGLLGTIIGLIISFSGVAEADPAQKAEILSRGISEALNCTAFGLIVAIPSLIAYGYYQTRVGHLINDVVESSMSLMNIVVSNRDKVKD